MEHATIFVVSLIVMTVILIALLVFRPGITATQGGKMLAFLVLFALPVLCMGMGSAKELQRSTSTQFCLSCHVMEPFGRSLHVDDPSYLPAAHFQNHLVPPDEACYTCHTNYAMFGTLKAKFSGLRHMYIYYLGNPPPAEDIKLYEPFNNRECLHCHAGARSFEEGATHTADPELLPALKANTVSCLTCHSPVHEVKTLNQQKFWKGGA
jgi:cytochrome c-type protein NapC